MITPIADNIISPLGMTSAGTFRAVMEGRSALRIHDHPFGLPEPMCGSLLDREAVMDAASGLSASAGTTFFETLCILSAMEAIAASGIDPAADDVVFILSTTKGNVDLLATDPSDRRCYPGASAAVIARAAGNRNTPVVVSNACISGVCAQIAASRLLATGRFNHAVVIGADILSAFIISGFMSFKALSPEPCRPFDRDRAGLNLGEAAATIILSRQPAEAADSTLWQIAGSSIHNDANHISGPSRTGEGACRVLTDLNAAIAPHQIAFISAHGTATAYNDDMEATAIHRAGLSDRPVIGLKGYLGHTLGAAGIVETILSMRSVEAGMMPGTHGFATPAEVWPPDLSPRPRTVGARAFLKILSGFGGTNAGIAWRKGGGAS